MDFEKSIKFITELKLSETYLLVEGIKDKRVLEKIGFTRVIDISGKSFETVVEKLKTYKITNIAILTDFDQEGIEKERRLTKILNSNGILIDENIRKRFKQNFPVNKIEELNYFVKNFLTELF